jgi:CHAD domain-containing protein
MAIEGKWIGQIAPDQPVSSVARRVLEARLEAVCHWLPLAAEKSDDDVEYVHKLRIATRRTTEALRTFRDLVGQDRCEELRGRLREIRQAANDARDCDVMGERFARLADRNGSGPLGRIVDRIKTRRKEAQEPILVAYRQLRDERFDQQFTQSIRRAGLPQARPGKREPKFGREARDYLRRVVKKFFKASRRDLSDPIALHGFRIRAKKLRYTMEIVAGAFDEGFRLKLYPRIEKLQERLGQINDHFTAQRRFQEWAAASENAGERKYLEGLASAERTALADSHEEFLRWWTRRRASKLRRRLKPYCSKRSRAEKRRTK